MTGEQLVLLFCHKPTPGTYSVAPSGGCPEEAPGVLLMRDGTVFEQADSGTVSITSSGDCMVGSFSASFSNEQLTGTFDAVVCPLL